MTIDMLCTCRFSWKLCSAGVHVVSETKVVYMLICVLCEIVLEINTQLSSRTEIDLALFQDT